MKMSITPVIALICLATATTSLATPGESLATPTVPADLLRFHGHECPGVAMGYRMALEGMKALPAGTKANAIVENRTCGVDGLQWVTGCTAGKGNLTFKDYGKQAYTLYSTDTKKGVRILLNSDAIPADIRKDKSAFIHWLLTADTAVFLKIQPVDVNEPEVAKTRDTAPCAACGEPVALTHLREAAGKKLCIPCAETPSVQVR